MYSIYNSTGKYDRIFASKTINYASEVDFVKTIKENEAVKKIIEEYLIDSKIRQQFKGVLSHVETTIKQAALDYAQNAFKRELALANEYCQKAETILDYAETVKHDDEILQAKIASLKAKRDELESEIQKLEAQKEQLEEPDTENRALIRLYDRLNADANSERNPIVKAQRIRSNGVIIAARFGLKSIGNVAAVKDVDGKAIEVAEPQEPEEPCEDDYTLGF
jgi:outer membrane murein-binding lipoprotein Lpp